jgi:hypothetical protein
MNASSTSVNAGGLKTLAENANRMHKQVEGAERQASKSAKEAVRLGVEAGEILLLAKEEVGHGRFTKWIEENFEGAPCRARLYRRLATAVEQGRIDPAEVSSIAEAERLLREQDAEPKRGFESEEPEEKDDFREPGAESENKEPETQEPEAATSNKPPPSKEKKQVPPDLVQIALDAINDALDSVDGQERVALADQFIARILLKEVTEPKAATESEPEFLSLGDPTKCFWYSEIRRPDEIVAFHYEDPEDEEECGVAYPIVDEGVVECEVCHHRGEIPPAMRAVLEASS